MYGLDKSVRKLLCFKGTSRSGYAIILTIVGDRFFVVYTDYKQVDWIVVKR
jgi:hypothetical protein